MALVLSRSFQQSVSVGPEITVTFLERRGKSARLMFVAPMKYGIRRAELPETAPSESESEPEERVGTLVLQRKLNEAVVIFDRVSMKTVARISVNSLKGNRISFALEADKSLRFLRTELDDDKRLAG